MLLRFASKITEVRAVAIQTDLSGASQGTVADVSRPKCGMPLR